MPSRCFIISIIVKINGRMYQLINIGFGINILFSEPLKMYLNHTNNYQTQWLNSCKYVSFNELKFFNSVWIKISRYYTMSIQIAPKLLKFRKKMSSNVTKIMHFGEYNFETLIYLVRLDKIKDTSNKTFRHRRRLGRKNVHLNVCRI